MKYILVVISVVILILLFFLRTQPRSVSFIFPVPQVPALTPTIIPVPTALPPPTQLILHQAPFTPQAPFSNWKDPIQQDACEEASSLMAVYWATGKDLTYQQALNQIQSASQYQKDTWGEYRDASAQDTLIRIIQGYFNYTNAQFVANITLDDIIHKLQQNQILIIPMNGQKLHNPYFTQPGPERHMVLVIGYDPKTQEFITNDPGVTNGHLYRYPRQILFDAIRDYSTGYHLPITQIQKNAIVISRIN